MQTCYSYQKEFLKFCSLPCPKWTTPHTQISSYSDVRCVCCYKYWERLWNHSGLQYRECRGN